MAPFLPFPPLRAAALAAPGRDGKAGSPIEQESRFGLRRSAASSPLSGRNSTYRPVRIRPATSLLMALLLKGNLARGRENYEWRSGGSCNGRYIARPSGRGTGLALDARPRGQALAPDVRGRDASLEAPPAQIRASGIPAHGSYLGCLTANRTLGQGWRIRGFGRNSSASFAIRSHTTYALWLRRHSCRCQSTATW
jgi:hypothetical protein